LFPNPCFGLPILGFGRIAWLRDYKAAANPAKGMFGNRDITPDRVAALIAWTLVVRVDDVVKDGAISAVTRVFDALRRRRLRRSTILDKIVNANRVLSKRSRPLSGPSYVFRMPRSAGRAGREG
jgi:hypothetical protein